MTPAVAAAFDAFPPPARDRLLDLRRLIIAAADETDGVGPLTEALKWGEPAYLTEATKSGSTIRLGWKPSSPNHAAVYVNCKTTLAQTFRILFADEFTFEGERALLVDLRKPLPEAALTVCFATALTYHRAKRKPPLP
jgi:hypothetical protein